MANEMSQERKIQQFFEEIQSRQFRSGLQQANALLAEITLVSYAIGLCNRVIHIFAWWSDVPLFSSLLYALCVVFSLKTCFNESQGSWIQVSSSLLYHVYMLYLCCKLERYIGSLRIIWAFVIWTIISLMFSMIYKGIIDFNFSGVCFTVLTVDAVVRRSRDRVILGFITIQTELYPVVAMVVCHFMEIGSLPYHICGVITGYAYVYGLFDVLQPGYVFLSKWETRLYWNQHPVVYRGRYRKFVSCTTYQHTSDVLGHIPISYILEFHAHNVFQQAPLDAKETEEMQTEYLEDLEPKIRMMFNAKFCADDATFLLLHCLGDLDAAFDIGLTMEIMLRKIINDGSYRRCRLFKYLRRSVYRGLAPEILLENCREFHHNEYLQRITHVYYDKHEHYLSQLNRWAAYPPEG